MTETNSQPDTPSSREGPQRTNRAGSRQGPRPPALRSIRTAHGCRRIPGGKPKVTRACAPRPPSGRHRGDPPRGSRHAPPPPGYAMPPPPPPARHGTKRAGSGRGAGAGTPRAPCWRGRRGPGGGDEQRNSRPPRPQPAAPRPHRARPAGGAEGRRPRTMRPGPAGCAHLGPRAARPTRVPLTVPHPAPRASHLSAPEAAHGAAVARSCSPPAQPEPDGASPPPLLAAAAARPPAATAHAHCARRTATAAPPRRPAPPDALRRREWEAGPRGEGGAWRCSPGGWGAHPGDQVLAGKPRAQTPAPTRAPSGTEQGREDERRVAGAGFYSRTGGRLSGTILPLCPGTYTCCLGAWLAAWGLVT
nr:basic proline-rich protein [Meriones unguiculatus]